jgi:hypothetical protein
MLDKLFNEKSEQFKFHLRKHAHIHRTKLRKLISVIPTSKVCPIKYLTILGAGRMGQVVQCLPNKCEALSSNPTTVKRKQKKSPKILYKPTTVELSADAERSKQNRKHKE